MLLVQAEVIKIHIDQNLISYNQPLNRKASSFHCAKFQSGVFQDILCCFQCYLTFFLSVSAIFENIFR